MTETVEEVQAETTPSPKGKKPGPKKGSGKKGTAAPTHPPIAQMVNAAIRELKEKGGSSTQAIKKYVGANYKVDVEKKAKFISKYLKAAVSSGALVQTKGKGASGSFKLPTGNESQTKKISSKKSVSRRRKTSALRKIEITKAPSKVKKVRKPPTTPKPPKVKKTALSSKVKKSGPAKSKLPGKKRSVGAPKKKIAVKK